jgi:hypothetical protein
MRLLEATILTPLLLLALGCATAAEPGWEREIGWVLEEEGLGPVLILADTVPRNTPVTATVVTRGSSSCTRADGAEVEWRSYTLHITPFDRMAPPGTPCTRDLAAFPRPVELLFTRSGEAEVVVVGRASPRGELKQIHGRVTVLP